MLRAPDLPQARYILGAAYLGAGLVDRAIACFQAATRLDPRFTEAWVNLGVALYRGHDIEGAKAAMRAALAIDPSHQAALGNLGAFQRLTGEGTAAESLLRQAIAAQPAAVAPRLNLAAELLQQERAAEALDLLPEAMSVPPAARAPWQLQRALAFLKRVQLAEARAALAAMGEVPPALEPLLQWRHVLLALAEGAPAKARSAATEMERLLAQAPAMTAEHRIMGHYDLARFWSRVGEPARAFAQWSAGHRLLAPFQPFSRAQHAAFIAASEAAFDARRFAGWRTASTDDAPVFIVGMPRSGTTLVEQILAAHPAVFGAGERVALAESFARLGGGSETPQAARRIAALTPEALDAAAADYLAALHALDPAAARIVDKMPGNYRFLGLVGLMLPRARIIFCERDPRDIGLSIFTFRFYGSHGYAHDLGDLGWTIGQQQRLAAHWRAVLPNPTTRLRLGDWVADFDGTLRRLLAFLDLPYDAACERFYEQDRPVQTVSRAQVRQPISAQGLGRWRAYEAELAPLITELRNSDALEGWE